MEVPAITKTEKESISTRTRHQNNILSYFKKPVLANEVSDKIKKKLKCEDENVVQTDKNEKENFPSSKLPKNSKQLEKYLLKVKQRIHFYKSLFFQEQLEMESKTIFIN